MNQERPSSPVKVFLVEDYLPIRNHIAELIQTIAGAHVVGMAEDADAAVAGIGASKPDVVIVDLQLKAGTSGIAVLKWLRAHAPQIASLVFSNIAYPQMRQACLDLGARLVFDKSSDALSVREAVAQIALERACA